VLERVTEELEDADGTTTEAAKLLLDRNVNLRDKGGSYIHPRSYVQAKFFGLPSHTQFVEAGVKEAKLVSQSDRSEELRSAYAICRSARVNTVGTLREMSSTQRIEGLMKSAQEHCKTHSALRSSVASYSDDVDAIVNSMRKESFKQERVVLLQQHAIDKGDKNRTENAIQKKRGVDKTSAQDGMISYASLRAALHLKDLEVELLHRGCTAEEVKAMKIRERIKKLKDMEVAMGNNSTAFTPLSSAQFQL
jgi:hypothetical protein